MIKRLPQKRGFVNIFRIDYSIVNLNKLNIFDAGSEVTPERLVAAGVVKSLHYPIKILAEGNINHPLLVRANKFSAAAKAKIEAAGGKVVRVLCLVDRGEGAREAFAERGIELEAIFTRADLPL